MLGQDTLISLLKMKKSELDKIKSYIGRYLNDIKSEIGNIRQKLKNLMDNQKKDLVRKVRQLLSYERFYIILGDNTDNNYR